MLLTKKVVRRLGKYYQLQVVSARTILAAADELGGSVKQVQPMTRHAPGYESRPGHLVAKGMHDEGTHS